MPQRPLPFLAARLAPQNLITPIVAGTSTPQDVISHMWNVDMIDKLQKGVNIGQQLARLPREGAENAAQKMYAELAKQQAKALQDQLKQIQQTTYSNDPAQNAAMRSQAMERAMIMSGTSYGPSGGGQNPAVPVNVLGPDYFRRPTLNQSPQGEVKVGEPTLVQPGTNTPAKAPIQNNTPTPNSAPQSTPAPEGFPIPHSNGQVASLGLQNGDNYTLPFIPAPLYYDQTQGGNLAPAPIA